MSSEARYNCWSDCPSVEQAFCIWAVFESICPSVEQAFCIWAVFESICILGHRQLQLCWMLSHDQLSRPWTYHKFHKVGELLFKIVPKDYLKRSVWMLCPDSDELTMDWSEWTLIDQLLWMFVKCVIIWFNRLIKEVMWDIRGIREVIYMWDMVSERSWHVWSDVFDDSDSVDNFENDDWIVMIMMMMLT